MDDAKFQEILDRLAAVEQALHQHDHAPQRCCGHHRHERCCSGHRSKSCCGHHRHERCCQSRERRHHPWRFWEPWFRRDCCHHDGFDEKRVVDLIVDLVAERVDELLRKYCCQASTQSPQCCVDRETKA